VKDYTQRMRNCDHDITVQLIEKQRALLQQLEKISQDLLRQTGMVVDHAAGFEHNHKDCATCALATKEVSP
jgi:hypothetical protein